MSVARPGARRIRRFLVPVAVSALCAAVIPPAVGAEPVPGGAGTDTSLAATDSQVTVTGRAPFASLEVTVNQTRRLSNQAISITWAGGTPTKKGPGVFAGHYLQIMQCWGDDDGTLPENPGPPPEQCVQGATDGVHGGRNGAAFPPGTFALERIVAKASWPGFDAADGYVDDRTGLQWKPFRSVDGKAVDVQFDPDFNPSIAAGNYWLNTLFNFITTNEIAGGRTGPNGKGAELFEVNTGLESSGLGCGQAVQPADAGGPTVPKCWLVIVPRGSPEEENVDAGHAPGQGVMTSPLSARAWQNRIAIPLEFNPVDSPCSLGDDQRRLVGTELVAAAVSSWQPTLCSTPGLPPYAYGIVSDAGARQQLLGGAAGAPGMVVVSRPFDPARLEADNPVTYAPITLSGVVIGFNVERVPNPNRPEYPGVEPLAGVRVADLNLTPRLVAKLLTQSYRSQVAIKEQVPPTYDWVGDNPRHLGLDPDFLQFNPEFELLQNGGKNFGGLVMSARNSDAAGQVWEWVLADPEARAWLDGAPDPWGMEVNPVYATTAEANSAGAAFADPAPDSFPKSEPYCYQGPPVEQGSRSIVPPLLCGTDWFPYAQSMREAARRTRAADDGARTDLNVTAESPDKVYRADGPLALGSRTILSLTDSASAAQYGLQMARLSRAGDDEPGRAFVAPDVAGLTAGAEAMTPKDEPSVLEPAPTAASAGAYPLTALTYAAITPLALDATARAEYASFVDYAAGPGQVAGLELGQLPRGFAPLSESLRAQATAAAKTIRELQPTPAPTTTAPTTKPTSASPGTTAAVAPSSSRSSTGGSGQGASTPPASGSGATETAAPVAKTEAPPSLPKALTPAIALAYNRFAMPGLLSIALLSALGALEIAKRPRYAPGGRPIAGRPAARGWAAGGRQVGAALRKRVTRRWPVKR